MKKRGAEKVKKLSAIHFGKSNVNSPSSCWKYGFAIGSMAGILEVILIYVVGSSSSPWLLVQAGVAWTLTGCVIFSTNSGLPPLLHGIFITLLLNVPWIIQETVLAGQLNWLLSAIVQNVFFGDMFGWAKHRWIIQDVPTV